MLTEQQRQKKEEVEVMMEGWMSQAAEDHRRLANRFEKIGLTHEDLQKVGKQVDHTQQMRSSDGDFMRNMFSKLDAVREGTFGPHNLPGADKEVDESEEEVDESDCGCNKTPCECAESDKD